MRILVTGARGLLGTPLCARLREVGHDVVATDLPELDVARRDAVLPAIERAAPDAVVHLAAWTAVDDCESDPRHALRVNAAAAGLVAHAAASVGASTLYVSTDYVFDGSKVGAYVEDDPAHPISVYGTSKLAGEEAVRCAGRDVRIVRCQSIYGRGRKSFADAILARARSGEPLRVVVDQTVSPSYADDLADAVAGVLLDAPAGTYHAANGGRCTWYEFARAVLDASGLADVAIERISAADLGRPAQRPANSWFCCDRLAAATGARPRPWQDALRAYLSAPLTPVTPRSPTDGMKERG